MALNDFITKIKTDNAARLNRFSVMINNPAMGSNELVYLYCEQAVLPGITLASQPIRTYGEQREVVYDRTFDTINLNFIVDRQYKVKEYFDFWIDKIINPSNRLVGFYNEYAQNMKITALDIKDDAMYETEIFEAYPKTIGAISLDNNSKDIARLQVTFNYKYHVNNRVVSMMNPDGNIGAITGIPKQYYDNFLDYQAEVRSRMDAITQIERQGIQVGSGYFGGGI